MAHSPSILWSMGNEDWPQGVRVIDDVIARSHGDEEGAVGRDTDGLRSSSGRRRTARAKWCQADQSDRLRKYGSGEKSCRSRIENFRSFPKRNSK
jgi:hypothetical protein